MLAPQLNLFDSGKLAARVGQLIVENPNVNDADIRQWIDHAAANRFDLVWVQSSTKLETTLLDYRGTLVELQGDRDEALSQVRLAGLRYDVRGTVEWQQVEMLLPFAAPTRFSTDPHIPREAARQHKMSLMKSHVENRNGIVALATTDSERAVGYHCASLDPGAIQLYEIAVHPEHRRGFVAVNLIRHSLEYFASSFPEIVRVATRIYDDNIPSLRLFEHLGLTRTGRQLHYYHCWPVREGSA